MEEEKIDKMVNKAMEKIKSKKFMNSPKAKKMERKL